MNRVVVIGGGVGGLSAATDLARRGFEVVVLERGRSVGGKMREVEIGGRRIDAGPTVLTMRWVFEELFADAGDDLDARVTLRPASILARHAWEDGSGLDLFADEDASVQAITSFAGAAEADGYRRFCAYARRIYEAVERPFLRSQRPTVLSLLALVGRTGLRTVADIDGRRTLWGALGDFFRDPRLLQLFGRYATYSGSSPFLAPATLNVIAHVEREGVFSVEGGMARLAEALRALATRAGATIRCGEEVASITVAGGRARGVVLTTGEALAADAVVMNGDVAALADGSLGPGPARAVAAPKERSLSAVTFALVAEASGFPLVRHNVFFSSDYRAEFRDLFERACLPRSPTVYVCAQDRGDAAREPGALEAGPGSGPERLLCLINAPATGDRNPLTTSEIDRCETITLERLRRAGLSLRPIEPRVVTTPSDFHRLFPGTGGALYGATSHGLGAALSRAPSRTRLPGLYLAGGSAHPGAGVPMAALSGRLAAQSLAEDLASTGRSRATGMPGGTSTPSATTGSTRSA